MKRIMACVPTSFNYGEGSLAEGEYHPLNVVHPATRRAFLETCDMNQGKNEIGVAGVHGDGMLDRARAFLFAQYLKAIRDTGEKFDYYWQLDGDVEWPPAAIERWLEMDLDVVGAAYTFKVPENHPKYGLPVIRPLAGAEVDPETGLWEVTGLGGGMIFVRHSALEKLMRDRPEELIYTNPDYSIGFINPGYGMQPTYHFWQCIPDPEPDDPEGRRMYLSEDYALCARLRQSGFKIYFDTRAPMRHWSGDKYFMLPEALKDHEETLRATSVTSLSGGVAYVGQEQDNGTEDPHRQRR
jgi:hypothetical protein